MTAQLREQEWIDQDDHGWFNGYYDDLGRRVEGIFNQTVQMTLTGQVFPLMFDIATDQQAQKITDSVQRYLYDPALNGVRLNTEFTPMPSLNVDYQNKRESCLTTFTSTAKILRSAGYIQAFLNILIRLVAVCIPT